MTRSSIAPVFRERLKVPIAWWVTSVLIMGVGGIEVFGGFNWEVAIVVYVILSGFFLVPLGLLGLARVVVVDGELRAGRRSLTLADIRSAQPLDVEGTRHALGPAADPAAHVVLRGWIKTAVLIRARGTSATPYWLISTRRPEQLAAILRTEATRALAADGPGSRR